MASGWRLKVAEPWGTSDVALAGGSTARSHAGQRWSFRLGHRLAAHPDHSGAGTDGHFSLVHEGRMRQHYERTRLSLSYPNLYTLQAAGPASTLSVPGRALLRAQLEGLFQYAGTAAREVRIDGKRSECRRRLPFVCRSI